MTRNIITYKYNVIKFQEA